METGTQVDSFGDVPSNATYTFFGVVVIDLITHDLTDVLDMIVHPGFSSGPGAHHEHTHLALDVPFGTTWIMRYSW